MIWFSVSFVAAIFISVVYDTCPSIPLVSSTSFVNSFSLPTIFLPIDILENTIEYNMGVPI